MIIVNIKPLKAELLDFNIKDDTAQMHIYFSDEADKHRIVLNKVIGNAEELAEQMIMEMRKAIKDHHSKEDDLLVIRVQDEEDAIKRMTNFFNSVKEKIKAIKTLKSAQGYLDTVNRSKKLEVNL